MSEKDRAIITFFKHLDFVGIGDAPMTFYFSLDKLTDEDKETANHIRLDVETGRIFDDREEGGEVEALRAEMNICGCAWLKYVIRWTRWSRRRDFHLCTIMHIMT